MLLPLPPVLTGRGFRVWSLVFKLVLFSSLFKASSDAVATASGVDWKEHAKTERESEREREREREREN